MKEKRSERIKSGKKLIALVGTMWFLGLITLVKSFNDPMLYYVVTLGFVEGLCIGYWFKALQHKGFWTDDNDLINDTE